MEVFIILYFLLAFSLYLTGLMFFIGKNSLKPMVKKATRFYAILFGAFTLAICYMVAEPHKDVILARFQPSTQEAATEVMATEHPIKEIVEEPAKMRLSVQIDTPLISQHPELPRGCEVTSLAMLLQHHDIDVDKMELAKKVKRQPYKYTKDGITLFGNPYHGFLGDMYSYSNPGYGVYHGPVAELAKTYVGDKVLDFTGSSFDDVLKHVNGNRPVWIITNTTYKKLDDTKFRTWNTAEGPVQITMKEHSVLVTGYDQEFIYFNDPTTGAVEKAPVNDFREAWEQMGQQAITIVD